MAVATAAIVCVLSVFNGFREVLGQRLDTMAPDVLVEPTLGKVFDNADILADSISRISGVAVASPVVADNALILFNGREMPVFLTGVDPKAYSRITDIKKLIPQSMGRLFSPGLDKGVPETSLSIGVARQLTIYPDDRILLFAPKREGRVNLANPATSFITDSLYVSGIFQSMNSDYDANRILVDLPTARRIFQYYDQASALYIKADRNTDPVRLADRLAEILGDRFSVKDRMRQQELNFRMVEIEKWISFLLLGFILMIAGFNVISTLSMLVLEKENSLSTLSALGMSRRKIGSIFAWESYIVALLGGIAGIIIGVVLCLLQEHFGLIRIGDGISTILSAYPVSLRFTDILITFIPIAVIGGITALITARFARSRV